MPRKIEAHDIAGPSGRLECLLEEPDEAAAKLAVVVCHPHPQYQGTMHNKVVYRMARGLRKSGAVVLRFNYRGVGRSEGEYGNLDGEIEDARAAVDWLRGRYPDLPFALAGFSFGARVITRLGCVDGGPQWLLAAGYPTHHGPGGYLNDCRIPKLFIQSTNDQYGPREELEVQFAGFSEPKRLVWVEAADHFFVNGLEELEAQCAIAHDAF